jgi:hypothetical protein
MEAREAGGKIQSYRPAAAQAMVAALDDWAAVRRDQRREAAGAPRLLAVARAADPDQSVGWVKRSEARPVGTRPTTTCGTATKKLRAVKGKTAGLVLIHIGVP